MSGQGSCVAFVINGVATFQGQDFDSGYHNFRGVVISPGLKKDISQQKILQNDEYSKIVTMLKTEVTHMMEQVLKGKLATADYHAEHIIEELSRNYRMKAGLKEALQAHQEILRLKEKRIGPQPASDYGY